MEGYILLARDALFWERKSGTFGWLVYFYRFCELLICYMGIQGDFLVQSKYAEYGILSNPYTADPGYWQNHVDYIVNIKAYFLFCEKLSATTILFDIKYFTSPLNSSNVLPIILCWFYRIHFEMWNIYSPKINTDSTVITKAISYKHSLWNWIILNVGWPTIQHNNLQICQFLFLFYYDIQISRNHIQRFRLYNAK